MDFFLEVMADWVHERRHVAETALECAIVEGISSVKTIRTSTYKASKKGFTVVVWLRYAEGKTVCGELGTWATSRKLGRQ